MTLHVFNPEHDMALAAGTANYTPPATIRRMARQLEWLPLLWCAEGDLVLGHDHIAVKQSSQVIDPKDLIDLNSPDNLKALNNINNLKALTPFTHLITLTSPLLSRLTSIDVWGWNHSIRQRLLRLGISPDLLPTDTQLNDIRRLSNRHTAVLALNAMRLTSNHKPQAQNPKPDLTGESWYCEDFDTARQRAESLPAAMLKAPWSSSGKGLLAVHGRMDEHQLGWLRNIIARQGAVVVERLCDKAVDCALLYSLSPGPSPVGRGVLPSQTTPPPLVTPPHWGGAGGEASYLGFSLFQNTHTGAYSGNILGSEGDKLAQAGISPATLQSLIDMHTDFLNREIAPYYSGLVGIDILVCRDGSINPCVEINLRRTMGHVALLSPLLAQQPSGLFQPWHTQA